MIHRAEIIKKPLISEKASMLGETYRRYGFIVAVKANKYQIKEAIEKLYNVKVLNVKTSILPGKLKRFGRLVHKSSKSKKALVQLEEGQKIEFFQGV